MEGVWTAQQVRTAENALMNNVPEGALMRRAAFGVAVHARRMLGSVAGRRVGLLVGAGNNGGDALWAGVELRRRGVAVTAVLLAPHRTHPAGFAALRRAGGRVCTADDPAAEAALTRSDLVIDGIVGIAGRGSLRPSAAALVSAVERAQVPILAVDLPSGVDPDTGAIDGPAVKAAATVTMGARKPVHVLAAPWCGEVHLVDIGLVPYLPEPFAYVPDAADVGSRWPVPGPQDDKYTQGVVGIAAGSATYPGAAVLATGAAVLATSGMVRYAGAAANEVRTRWPEIIATEDISTAGRVQAWTVGPGIGTDQTARRILAAAVEAGVPLCLDADAINLLAEHAELRAAIRGRPVVLTPHDREFARVAGSIGADRVEATRRAAANLGVTVLLKGHATVIADPDGRTQVVCSPSSWPATAGSGDVLAGIIGALLASGLPPWWAAGCAAYLHGQAALLAADDAPIPASHLQAAIPEAIRSVRAAARNRAVRSGDEVVR